MPSPVKESAFKDLKKIREIDAVSDTVNGAARLGRPQKPGAKSRDPEYRAWTGYLKRDTVTDADYQLKRTRDGRTMSELVEELLSGWVSNQSKG